MQKGREIILILSIIANVALGFKLYSKDSIVKSDSKEFIAKIDSLESELFSIKNIRDSVNREIDTVFIELKVIEKEYEEKYINVISNSTIDDYVFFANYLKRNRERLDSINNFRTAKGN